MAEEQALSKSAKRRAAKKARDAATEEAPAPATTINKENATGNKAQQSKVAAPEPKTKAEPKPESKAKAAAAAPAAKPESKPKAQPKPKAVTKPVQEEPEEKKKEGDLFYSQVDDGTGPQWEVSTGLSKKAQKARDKKAEEKKAMAAAKAAGYAGGGKVIPGMQNFVPGMAPPSKNDPAVPQGLQAPAKPLAAAQAAMAGVEAQLEAQKADSNTVTITVQEARLGIIIGPKGAKLNMIKEKTGVKGIDISGNLITVTGDKQAVAQAETAIKELNEKGYTALSYDDFEENFVMVHPTSFPDLIGKKGAVIIKMKEELQVEVKIPQDVPKSSDSKKKYKVTIAGKKDAVEKAKAVITEIITYYHSEITHPGEVHEEIEVPSWALSFVIGKGGSEMRHIQNNYKVRVYIPRETSLVQNVLIVGLACDVPRAKAYVEKLLYNAEQGVKGRDRKDGDDGDVWGDEEPEEDWMKQYLYKRG